DISVAMTAPTTNGTFKGNWRMQNDKGLSFGNVIYVEIKVGSGSSSTVTPGPSPTAGAGIVTISGNAGALGATIAYSGTTSGQVTSSESDGSYSISVSSGWSGTLIPSKGSGTNAWTFSPASQNFTNVAQNTIFNFVGTPAQP
ncbi:MAG: NBR1-Ig-like domain-containing protein, partial [Chloroflexota bacterium]